MTSSDPTETRPDPVLPLDWARQAGKVDVVLHTLAAKLKKRRRRQLQSTAAIVSLALLVLGSFWAVPWARDTATIATVAGQRETVTLADGSAAELNARTGLRTDFRYRHRVVHLDRGEAFFSVAKDPAHPFLVETPAGTIRVMGTHFNVRLEDGAAVVTLVEGAVAVNRELRPTVALRPGEQLVLGQPPTAPRSLTSTEIENTLSWRSGRLALDGLTLGEAAARFAAYHGQAIVVAPAVAALPLGGSCPLNDLPGFLEFLKEAFPVYILPQGDGSFRIVAQAK